MTRVERILTNHMEGDSPYSVLFFIALAFGYICGRSKCDEEKAIL